MEALTSFLKAVLQSSSSSTTSTDTADKDDSQQGRQDEELLLWQPEIPLSKEPSESWVTMTELVLPFHCDGRGYCLGGTVLSWIDIAAGIAAKKHGVYPAVTRSVDAVHFLGPITTKNIVIIQACVNRAWKTSMEVGVRVVTEDLLSADRRYCCHAYLTFVALPQPPLATLTTSPTAPQGLPHKQAGDQEDSAAVKAALVNSPAARRYSFSLPSANKSKSKSSDGNSNSANNNQRKIQLPAIEPITQIEMERYTLAQSRREARLLQASSEYNLEEEKLLSDVRDQMRHWNVSQINHPRTQKLPPSLVDGSPQIAMQATFSESAQLVLPQHANSLSITFGGQVMKWMENVAAVSASRFARVPIVTASIDSLQFHRKTMIGDCLTMRSVVTRVFRSSMEVYVFVDSENLVTGKQTFTNEAFFSMVALQPSPSLSPIKTSLPTLFAASDLERSLSEAGEKRRLGRLQQRRELVEREMRGVLHTPTVERDEHSLRAADHITIGQYTHTE